MRDDIPKHYKKGGAKKLYVIERRFIGDINNSMRNWMEKWGWLEWHIYKKYKTHKDRAKAIERLTSKGQSFRGDKWEYRIPDEDI